MVPDHFKKYSHQKLASSRSLKSPKNITCDEVGWGMVYTIIM